MTETFATGDQDVFLFDLHCLSRLLKWLAISEALETNNLLARPLKLADFENGYNQLLAKLTTMGDTTRGEFEERFSEMRMVNMVENHYLIVVLEDTMTQRVVASATLLLELKFIHRCSVRGRMEDIAFLDSHGKECGGLLIEIMVELAREIYNCYKLSVNCGPDQRKFFTDKGFSYGSNVLSIKFNVNERMDTKIPTAIDSSRDNVYLFDQRTLSQLPEWTEIEGQLGENNLLARPLKLDDYENGYLELLEQLTIVGGITKRQFEDRFSKLNLLNQTKNDLYKIVIVEDKITQRVVGASTLFMELKYVEGCSVKARLEDVAVLDTYRGKKIGELVVKIIVQLARETSKCSIISLDCDDDLKKFYAKNNFVDDCDMFKIKFYD